MLVAEARRVTIHYGESIAVKEASCVVGPGEVLGIAGVSGSGKSTLLRALHGHLPPGARISAGSVERWGKTAYIEQEASLAFSPYLRLGEQLAHCAKDRHRDKLEELLAQVRLADPKRAMRAYPHEMSGGELQRVAFAQALAARPDAILADEPTTAMDPVLQREIVTLALEICRERGLALVWVSHNRPMLAAIADRVLDMDGQTQ